MPGNARKQYVEPSKLRVNQTEMDLGVNISLGNRQNYLWNKDKEAKPDERKLPAGGLSITQNKYALLEEKPHSRSSSLKGNLPSGADLRDNRDNRPARPSLHGTFSPAYAQSKNQFFFLFSFWLIDDSRSSRSSQQFRPSPMSRDTTPVVVPVAAEAVSTPAPPVLDSDAIERAAKTMVEQFVSDSDYKVCLVGEGQAESHIRPEWKFFSRDTRVVGLTR